MENYDEAGIHHSNTMIFSKYAIEAIRLKTFEHWPKQMVPRPKELAEAGFFYTGKGDAVICFCCKLGAKNWEKDDVPWEQHILHAVKNCSFLSLMKEKEYIDEVKAKFQSTQAQAAPKLSSPPSPTSIELPTVSPSETCCEKFEEKLRETRLCKMCYTNEINLVFIPCGHIFSCIQCYFAVKECPFCRQPINDVMKIYFT